MMTRPLASLLVFLATPAFAATTPPPASARPAGPATEATAPSTAPAIGSPAPELAIPDADGRVRRLDEFRGKVVVLEWLNPGCPFVKKFYAPGAMQARQKEFAAKGVIWLSVASTRAGHPDHQDGAALKTWMSERGGTPAAILLDTSGALARRYAAKTTPHLFVIGSDGKLVYRGAIDSGRTPKADEIATAEPYLANAVNAALAGKPASPAETKPYGCSVKL